MGVGRKENLLLILTVIGVAAGIILGFGIKLLADEGKEGENEPSLPPKIVAYLRFPGELFLRMLKMLILPLITSSLVTSMANLDSKTAGRLGIGTLAYYLSTTFLAVLTGLVLVALIQPGNFGKEANMLVNVKKPSTCQGAKPFDTILDLLRNMVPANILQAGLESQKTCIRFKTWNNTLTNATEGKTVSYEEWEKYNSDMQNLFHADPFLETQSRMNVLGIIVFSLVLGFVISRLGEPALPLARLFAALEVVTTRMVTYVIWLSPIGVLFLIASEIVKMNNLWGELSRLAMYMVTVIAGLLLHACVTLPLILYFIGKRNPLRFTYNMLQALLTAFGTASSAATMSITLECLETKNHISHAVSRFVIPLGATINMDGTALYEAVAVIFIAQSTGEIDLNIGSYIVVSLTATLASIGAAAIPQAGLVTMIMVLLAVGLDPKHVTLILSVDWFLDRIRTAVNVHGDSYGAGVVETWCQSGSDSVFTDHKQQAVKTSDLRRMTVTPIELQMNGEQLCKSDDTDATAQQPYVTSISL